MKIRIKLLAILLGMLFITGQIVQKSKIEKLERDRQACVELLEKDK